MAVVAASLVEEGAAEVPEVGNRPPSAAGLEEVVPLVVAAVAGSNNTDSNSNNLRPSPEGLVVAETG